MLRPYKSFTPFGHERECRDNPSDVSDNYDRLLRWWDDADGEQDVGIDALFTRGDD